MPDDSVWIHRARELAAQVFAPAARRVEATQRVPPEHLDLLAAESFYGLAGPREAGGLDVPFPEVGQIIEVLAGACLSTTFVWMQHHSVVRVVRVVRVVAGTANTALRQEMLRPLCRGERRAGLALAGLLPGPPRLRAWATEGGYVLDGTSPWVTGWGLIDTLYVAARQDDDTIVWAVLDDADPATMPAARAAACELAVRATAALVVSRGSVAILADQDAQRLAREALFLLVFGSRPSIRQSLAGLLTRPVV